MQGNLTFAGLEALDGVASQIDDDLSHGRGAALHLGIFAAQIQFQDVVVSGEQAVLKDAGKTFEFPVQVCTAGGVGRIAGADMQQQITRPIQFLLDNVKIFLNRLITHPGPKLENVLIYDGQRVADFMYLAAYPVVGDLAVDAWPLGCLTFNQLSKLMDEQLNQLARDLQ